MDSPGVDSRLTAWRHLVLGAVLLLALGVRGAYLWDQARGNPICAHPVTDALAHHEWAGQIASGQWEQQRPYFRAPLYYYLLGLLYSLFGPDAVLGRLAGCLLGGLGCYLIARLGVALAGFSAGVLAGIIAALYWPLVYFDGELLTVGLEVFLNTGTLLLFVLAVRRRTLWLYAAAGLAGGLSAITRANVLALAPAILVWLWFVVPKEGRFKRWLAAALVTGVAAALPVLPVTLRNYFVGDDLVLIASTGGLNFYIGNNPESDGCSAVVPGVQRDLRKSFDDAHRIAEHALGREASSSEVSRYWYGKAFEWIRAEPGAWLGLVLRKLRLFWSPLELPNNQPIWFFARLSRISAVFWIGFPLIASLGLAGFVLQRRPWRDWTLLLVFLLIYMAMVVAFFCTARYRLPVVPVLIVAAAAGLVRLPRAIRSRHYSRLAAYALVLAAAAGAIATNPPHHRDSLRAMMESEGHRILAQHYHARSPRTDADVDRAVEHYTKAAALGSRRAFNLRNLAMLLLEAGRGAEVIDVLREGVRQTPRDPRLLTALAWIRATAADDALRDADEAVRLAEQARALVGRPNAGILDVLAAAYAEAGRFDDAVRLAGQAAEIAGPAQAAAIRERLRLYGQRLPYREE